MNVWRFIAVTLLRNKSESTTVRKQVSQPASAGKDCALALPISGASRSRLSGLTLMSLAFIYLALPTCLVVYVQKSDFHLINVFCVVIVKKCRLLCLAQVDFSYFVLHSSKIPLVLTTKVTHFRSLLLRQRDGVNCVVRGLFWGVSQNRVVQ